MGTAPGHRPVCQHDGVSRPRPTPTRRDRERQVAVTAGLLVCLAGAVSGSGRFGLPPVNEAADGRLSSSATLLAPAGPAFAIWGLIYLMLIGYTWQQWRPRQAVRRAHRRTGWWAALAMALAGLWVFVTQLGWLWPGVALMLGICGALGMLLRRLRRLPDLVTGDLIFLDTTFGIFLGWVSVATVAGVTAALVASGVRPTGWIATGIAIAVLVLVGLLGTAFVVLLGDRVAVALAMAWGLGWIAVARYTGQPHDLVVAIVAAAIAVHLIGFTLTWPRIRRDH